MPKRSASHQLETASILALQARLPPSWVFRSEHPDYGIDGSIEVFTPDGGATGLRCLVQLKSTFKGANRPSVRIRKDTGEYYHSLDLPVLIVLYELDRDRLLARWFHEFDPFYGGLGEKSITFPLRDEHAWSDATAERIEGDLRTLRVLRGGSLPLPIPMEISVTSQHVGGLSRSALLFAVRRELRAVPSIFKEDPASAVLWIRIDDEKTVASFRDKHSASLHHFDEPLSADSYAKDVLLLISLAAGLTGDHSLAATLAGRVAGKSKLMRDPNVVTQIAMSMVRSRRIALLLDVAEQMVEDPDSHISADSLFLSAVLPDEEGHSKAVLVEEFLRRRIQRAEAGKDPIGLATACYNLGNQLRGQGRTRESLRFYRRAAESHPGYAKRDYYCKEIGGLLFDAGRYSASVRFYHEATRMGARPAWIALYADALLFAGSFPAAREAFEVYFKSEPHPEAQWILKHWVAEVICHLDRSESGRRPGEAQRILETELVPGPWSGVPINAIFVDPLCLEAWFRIVESEAEDLDPRNRAVAMIVASVVARNDAKLWALAFVQGCGVPEFKSMEETVAFAALNAVGDAFAIAVLDFASFAGLEGELLDQLTEELGRLEERFQQTSKPDTYEVRLSGPAPDYETITLVLGEPGREFPAAET